MPAGTFDHDHPQTDAGALRRRLLLGGAVTSGLAVAAALPGPASARAAELIGPLASNVEEPVGWKLASPPAGGQLDDSEQLQLDLDALTTSTTGTTVQGLQLRAATYQVHKTLKVKEGVRIRGEGSHSTLIVVQKGGNLVLGDLKGGRTKPIHLTGLRIRGYTVDDPADPNSDKVPTGTLVRIRRSVESWFEDVEVVGGPAGVPAVTIDTTQNATFVHCSVTDNDGGGIRWDLGVNNILLVGCIVSNNKGYNHWFRRTIDRPAQEFLYNPTAGADEVPNQGPANIKFIGGLCEAALGGPNFKISSGRNINFIGSQTSRENPFDPTRPDSPDTASILMQGGGVGAVTWTSGQARGANDGTTSTNVIAEVHNGVLHLDGGAQLLSAATAFKVGNNGLVRLNGFQATDVIQLYSTISGTTKHASELIEFHGTRRRVASTTELTSQTRVAVPYMRIPVEADEVLEVEANLIVDASTDTLDMRLSWLVPDGTSMTWWSLAPATTADTPDSPGTRAVLDETQSLAVGVLADQKVAVTLRGEISVGSEGGNVVLRAAKVADTTGTVTIHPTSTMRARRIG